MTIQEFDNTQFMVGDEVVVRKYFGKERIGVEFIDIKNRLINGYTNEEIIKYIRKNEAWRK